MTLTREQKKNILEDLKNNFTASKAAVFSNYQGLKVNEIQQLRKKLREKKISYVVTKNSLVRKALEENKIEIDQSILDQPLAIAFAKEDEVEPHKILFQFSKEKEKLQLLGSIVNGQFIDSQEVERLAKLPSREELYVKIVGSVAAPLSGLVSVLQGNLRGLVAVLSQYQKTK